MGVVAPRAPLLKCLEITAVLEVNELSNLGLIGFILLYQSSSYFNKEANSFSNLIISSFLGINIAIKSAPHNVFPASMFLMYF